MVNKGLLIGLSMLSPLTTGAVDTNPVSKVQNDTAVSIFQDLNKDSEDDTNVANYSEILQEDLKHKIVEWILVYFDNDVTFKMNEAEKGKLKKDLEIYLSKYPNIIFVRWERILFNINEKQFKELLNILLPYFWKGDALKNYPRLIRENENIVVSHIKKSKWKDAEFYFFHYFGYLIMEIVKASGDYGMTIDYYKNQMLKAIPNSYIHDNVFDENFLSSDIRDLPKYF